MGKPIRNRETEEEEKDRKHLSKRGRWEVWLKAKGGLERVVDVFWEKGNDEIDVTYVVVVKIA